MIFSMHLLINLQRREVNGLCFDVLPLGGEGLAETRERDGDPAVVTAKLLGFMHGRGKNVFGILILPSLQRRISGLHGGIPCLRFA
jgi:hypothetical protein